jgi:hypothetical protein
MSFYKGLGKRTNTEDIFLRTRGVRVYLQTKRGSLFVRGLDFRPWLNAACEPWHVHHSSNKSLPRAIACVIASVTAFVHSLLKVGRQQSLGLRWLFFVFVMVKTLIIYSQAWFIPSSSTNRILARTRHFLEAKDWSCQWRVWRFKPGIGCRRMRCRSKVALNYTSASLEPT